MNYFVKHSPHSNDKYTIGWISALKDELMVAMAMLDEEHGRPQDIPYGDTNAYYLGRIGDHNVVMACLTGGRMGTAPAAVVAENMRRTFKNIRFSLVVGIGGGVPSSGEDIRLGDVVVSYPNRSYTGIVQYDYGKLESDGVIERKDWFRMPPQKLLAAVDLLKAYHYRPKNPINDMPDILKKLGADYAFPDEQKTPDRLFHADYNHDPKAETCDTCDTKKLVLRRARSHPYKPQIHHGIIASGGMVVKNGLERDKINRRYENSILCFEMEAAGLMNNFECLVVRGISDYCDSHKNDEWRKRAIAVAAAYTKELLCMIEPAECEILPPISPRLTILHRLPFPPSISASLFIFSFFSLLLLLTYPLKHWDVYCTCSVVDKLISDH
jgi:nucleoside phosphorylase